MTEAVKDISELVAADYNPRRAMTKKEAAGLARSLQKYGDVGGITFNRRSGRLVCGHQRVGRLREMGAQVVNGALQIASGHRFPIRVVDWDENTEREANVSANNDAIASDWDDTLEELLTEVRAAVSPEEFSELAFDDLLKSLRVGPAAGETEDASPQLRDDMVYSIVVEAADEGQQLELLAELEGRGLKCRLLMS